MNKKLIFFDIDGTLVSHAGKSHIPEPTVQAVKKLTENGHVAAIATGRNFALTRQTAAFFNIDLVVCCNGAHVTRLSGSRDIYNAWLGSGFISMFRDEVNSVSQMAYALDAEYVYSDWERDFIDSIFDEKTGADRTKKLTALERAQAAYVFAKPPRAWLDCKDVDVIEERDYTEFRPCGISKWSGIARAAAEFGFELADVVTVGDGLNDIEMVKNAPFGIAVGGADESLKAVADFVAEDIDEGGILSAFRSSGMV